ncbi:MAG: pentapeptide repeat-containing protein [Anaerolineae bacterium]
MPRRPLLSAALVGAAAVLIRLGVRAQLAAHERRRLIDQLSSPVRGFPTEAVRLLKQHGWFEARDVVRGLRAKGDFHRADLRGIDLRGQDLESVTLSHADLRGADLREARLTYARLDRARLAGAQMQGATLAYAGLSRADLSEVRAMHADFSRARLHDAGLTWAWLSGCDLRWANLGQADLMQARLEGAALRGAHLKWAVLAATRLHGADLSDADLRLARALTVEQLRTAASLARCTLPDGTRLPESGWAAAFEAWVERMGEAGHLHRRARPVWDEAAATWAREPGGKALAGVEEWEIATPRGSQADG